MTDLKPVVTMLKAFIFALPAVLLFEAIYKLFISAIIRPLLSFIFQRIFDMTGTSVVYNEGIFLSLLQIPGIIAFVLSMLLMALFIYYEFSVLFLFLYYRLQGDEIALPKAMKLALPTLRSLKGLGIIGFTFYSVGLLPLMHLGLCPTILSQTTIPRFITGELMKTIPGTLLVIFGFLILVFYFFRWLFVLPSMIFGQNRFKEARGTSLQLMKHGGNVLLVFLGVYFLIWVVLFIYPAMVPTYFPGVTGSGPIDLIRYIVTRHTIVPMLANLLVWILRVCLSSVLIAFLIKWYIYQNGAVAIDTASLPLINRYTGKTWETFKKAARGTIHRLIPAMGKVRRSSFVQRNRKKLTIGGIVVVGFCLVYIFYSPGQLHDPIVIGHRGSNVGVENTIEAVQGAIDAGADYAEIDILLSKDSVPMVIHDSDLSRLAGENKEVGDLTAEELGELTLSSNGATGKISTLAEMLDYTEGKINLVVELKEHGKETEDVAQKTGEVIEEKNAGNRCIFMSQEYDLVESMKRYHPDYQVGYCIYGNVGRLSASELRELGVDFLTVEENMVSQDFIRKCNRAWLPVYVWTVNNTDAMQNYLETGALGIITDMPGEARTIVDQYKQN